MPKNPEREGSPSLITPQQIEQEYGIKRSTLYTYRHRPTFPKPVKVEGSIKTYYRAGEVADWIAANPKQQGRRTDLAPDPDQGEPVTTATARDRLVETLKSPGPVGLDEEGAAELVDAYRASVLRELADDQERTAATDVIQRRRSIATGRRLFAMELRRMADETGASDG